MMRLLIIAALALSLSGDVFARGFMSGVMPGQIGGASSVIVCPAFKTDLSLAAVGTTAGCNIPGFLFLVMP